MRKSQDINPGFYVINTYVYVINSGFYPLRYAPTLSVNFPRLIILAS